MTPSSSSVVSILSREHRKYMHVTVDGSGGGRWTEKSQGTLVPVPRHSFQPCNLNKTIISNTNSVGNDNGWLSPLPGNEDELHDQCRRSQFVCMLRDVGSCAPQQP